MQILTSWAHIRPRWRVQFLYALLLHHKNFRGLPCFPSPPAARLSAIHYFALLLTIESDKRTSQTHSLGWAVYYQWSPKHAVDSKISQLLDIGGWNNSNIVLSKKKLNHFQKLNFIFIQTCIGGEGSHPINGPNSLKNELNQGHTVGG